MKKHHKPVPYANVPIETSHYKKMNRPFKGRAGYEAELKCPCLKGGDKRSVANVDSVISSAELMFMYVFTSYNTTA